MAGSFYSRKKIIAAALCAVLLLISIPLLGADSAVFFKWYLMALAFGIGFYPLTESLFSSFSDRGWIFSKVLGILLSGYLAFTLISYKILIFDSVAVISCTVILMALCWTIRILYGRKFKDEIKKPRAKSPFNPELILFEEILFIVLFLVWTYFAGFKPEAHSTEKFMDYGFMAALMRDNSLPPRDLWYSAGNINYYYGGQYYAVFLTKLTGTKISETYNLMRTFVASFAFVMPFSVVYHLTVSLKNRQRKNRLSALPALAGLLSGTAVSLAGNVHYILYGLFGSLFRLSGYENYWFPSSTRYIGHNPETADACIHEFPSYSFVLGDLHAHVVNIIFVLLFIGLLLAWFKKKEGHENAYGVREVILDPHVLIMGAALGIFRFTNYWDFVIYMTVAVIAFILAFLREREKLTVRLRGLLLRGVCLITAALIVSRPFMMNFESMTDGIAFSVYHSEFYQLLILWGLPAAAVLALLLIVIRRHVKLRKIGKSNGFIRRMPLSDMFSLMAGICAIGLVLVPEIIYAIDIYDGGLSRCNTMFKMTYQAYILFGISMIYGIIKLICLRKIAAKAIGGILLGIFALTLGYFPYAVSCWFGDVFNHENYLGLDATAFLHESFPQDAQVIDWLNENIDGTCVVLEANGESYSDFQRISSFTGLPTVLGWLTHEWLWRGDVADVYAKSDDVKSIYTSDDLAVTEALTDKYDIEYIVVGSREREKFPELNEDMLKELGEVVFESASVLQPSYVIQLNRN